MPLVQCNYKNTLNYVAVWSIGLEQEENFQMIKLCTGKELTWVKYVTFFSNWWSRYLLISWLGNLILASQVRAKWHLILKPFWWEVAIIECSFLTSINEEWFQMRLEKFTRIGYSCLEWQWQNFTRKEFRTAGSCVYAENDIVWYILFCAGV